LSIIVPTYEVACQVEGKKIADFLGNLPKSLLIGCAKGVLYVTTRRSMSYNKHMIKAQDKLFIGQTVATAGRD